MSPPTLEAPSSIVTVDTARWPLIYVRWVGLADAPVMEAYLRDLTVAITTRPGKRVMIMDATDLGMVSAAGRKMQADWMKLHDANTRARTAGIAFVLPSALLRGGLTAVLWLQPLGCPYAVVKDVPTAVERCRRWLSPFGLDIPD